MTVIDFEIRVRGQVDPETIAEVGDFDVATASATTILIGQTADQAALIGMLTRLRALGLTVVEVRQAPDDLPGPSLDAN
jgi:hypothetical protein